MTSRQDREREFHNRLFAEEAGRPADVFYATTRRSFEAYEDLVASSRSGARVLEYGCGRTSYAFQLAARGAEVIGIDISEVAVKQSADRAAREGVAGRLEFRVMDAETLEFPAGSLDLICGTGILHHLSLERAYESISRTLDDTGEAVFLEPLGHNPLINLYRRMTPSQRSEDEHPLLMSDIERAGDFFEMVELRFFHLASLMAIPLRRRTRFSGVLGALDSVDASLFQAVPAARRYAWMVLMTFRGPRR